MITPEYLLMPMLMNHASHLFSHMKTDILLLDSCLFLVIVVLFFVIDRDLRRQYWEKCIDFFKRKRNTIIISTNGKKRSIKFRAIMFYVAKNKTCTDVRCLKEKVEFYWDEDDSRIEISSEYQVDQMDKFVLDKNIYGYICKESREKNRNAHFTEIQEYDNLNIYSYKLSVYQLQKWIETQVDDFKKHLRYKTSAEQLLIMASTNEKDEFIMESVPWDSSITLENSYFPGMDETMSKIDFFLNNKAFYLEKGIPYNLGILLYGEPGCGKTRFIKLLLNYTKRHGIDIKLNDELDLRKLSRIIYKEDIGDNYIIPQDERILIFEDIDAMGDVVKDRDLVMKSKMEEKEFKSKLVEGGNQIIPPASTVKKKMPPNNNLSYFLNMIDGLHECSGRIIVLTTNKIDMLDKAVIRPGRIDIKLHFQKFTRYDVFRMIQLYWTNLKDIKLEDIRPDVEMKYTSAEISNLFRSTNDFNSIRNLFLT
jgi:ATP-dependent 26S proteasome regulatory subunit